jgi:arsenate reductase (thioredoxin)
MPEEREGRRILVLCTHNSARSQMAEGLIRHEAERQGLALEVWSAGTERTHVKPEAITALAEIGIDIAGHTSKRLDEVDDPWAFDVVLTVCDAANEACPVYPAAAVRLHVAFPDPSAQPLARWREVRDAIAVMARALVRAMAEGRTPVEDDLRLAATVRGTP